MSLYAAMRNSIENDCSFVETQRQLSENDSNAASKVHGAT